MDRTPPCLLQDTHRLQICLTHNSVISVEEVKEGEERGKEKQKKHRRTAKGRRSRKGGKRSRRRGKQKGGYAQYQSNVPLTWTQQLPAGDGGGSWQGQLASPPTYSRADFCHNNYNHFLGTNTASPVLDQAAP